jgi:hypothetical protein
MRAIPGLAIKPVQGWPPTGHRVQAGLTRPWNCYPNKVLILTDLGPLCIEPLVVFLLLNEQ